MGLFDSLKQLFAAASRNKLPRIDLEQRFELRGQSNQGSMSRVFPAIDRQSGKLVCVKILDKEKTEKFEKRFTGLDRPMEGAVCLAMRHKNVVKTLEHGLTTKGEQYVVMERLEGEGLNFLIETRSKKLNGKRIGLCLQMADGLEYIHNQGYLHRDICPRNFMVTPEGVVKYIDFGLAIPNRPEFHKPGNRTGTPNYLAPEIIKRQTTDLRVDLFALGVTAYETIAGALPWESFNPVQTMQEHVNNPGRDPRAVCPDLDDATARFLSQAIQRNPRDRFQNAQEFRDALRKLPKKSF